MLKERPFNVKRTSRHRECGEVEYILGVSIDLSKAFNTVDHQILIKKSTVLWN